MKLKHVCDLNKIVEGQGSYNKFVYGCRANSEILPFSDNSFNAYISNLSLMIVSNPVN